MQNHVRVLILGGLSDGPLRSVPVITSSLVFNCPSLRSTHTLPLCTQAKNSGQFSVFIGHSLVVCVLYDRHRSEENGENVCLSSWEATTAAWKNMNIPRNIFWFGTKFLEESPPSFCYCGDGS